MVVSSNADGATKYFTDSLSVGDYYAEGQKCQGVWHGRGASLLELTGADGSGEVTREQFGAMAFNKHPKTGEPLTERTVGNRRVGYDITFDGPKSLSVLYGITQDAELLHAFRSAVDETMLQMQLSPGASKPATHGRLKTSH